MKNLFISLLFAASSVQAAGNLNVELDSVTLSDLIKITYGDLETKNIMMDDDLFKNQKKYSLKIHDLKPQKMKAFLDNLLEREGFQIQKIQDIYSINKRLKESDFITMIYTPKFRSSNEIVTAIKQSFPQGTFGRAENGFQGQQVQNVETSGTSALDSALNNSQFITVKAIQSDIEKFKELVLAVDKPVPELLITTYIYEVANDKTNENTLNLTANILGSKLGLQTAGSILDSFLSIKTFGISAIISALNTDTRYKVLSSPFIRVRHQQNANFNVGSDVPVLGAIQTNTNGVTNQSIEYRQSGIILNIQPQIYDEQIELKIKQELSNFVQTRTGVNASPTLIKRSIDTVVNANNDEVIILGGLDETRNTQSTSGLPLLPTVLHNTTKSNIKNSIILVMHVKRI